jgi:hypothetical protein
MQCNRERGRRERVRDIKEREEEKGKLKNQEGKRVTKIGRKK